VQVLAICFTVLQTPRVIAESPPLPTASPNTSDLRPSATFTFADGTNVTTRSAKGRFRPVGLHLNEVVGVSVQFPGEPANTPVTIQALDGGNLPLAFANAVIASDGTVSFQFQAGNKPGLYRVSVIGAGGNSTLSFLAADPNNPQPNRPVVNPAH
jgi:hypothetical protein